MSARAGDGRIAGVLGGLGVCLGGLGAFVCCCRPPIICLPSIAELCAVTLSLCVRSQWVKNNIAAFNGDSNNIFVRVTRAQFPGPIARALTRMFCCSLQAFGESAGAGSLSAHLVNPRSAGLFHSVGLESGPFAAWIALNISQSTAGNRATRHRRFDSY